MIRDVLLTLFFVAACGASVPVETDSYTGATSTDTDLVQLDAGTDAGTTVDADEECKPGFGYGDDNHCHIHKNQ